jgi:hypothetical protein
VSIYDGEGELARLAPSFAFAAAFNLFKKIRSVL